MARILRSQRCATRANKCLDEFFYLPNALIEIARKHVHLIPFGQPYWKLGGGTDTA